jgi:platelet-activating factor acetylhydrolase IB subunit alpha
MLPLNAYDQNGHDNWIRALVFHPCGKYLLSASDDKTIKVWDLQNGRCTKTVDAHDKFVTCMSWGRAAMSGGAGGDKVNGDKGEVKLVNVLATGSVDQSVKVSYWSRLARVY